MKIDPTVPVDLGVRVVELTSARFPDGSAESSVRTAWTRPYRSIMKMLPKITALVIGHSD